MKIGYCATAEGVAKRVCELQVGNPRRLRLVATVRGTREAERQLHQRFAAIRMVGEWFDTNTELIRYAEALGVSAA
jgi:hypothetical protein